jgi:hypothetical protein
MVKIIKDLSFEEPFLDLSQFKGQKIEITVLEIHDLSSRISSDQVQIEDKKKLLRFGVKNINLIPKKNWNLLENLDTKIF